MNYTSFQNPVRKRFTSKEQIVIKNPIGKMVSAGQKNDKSSLKTDKLQSLTSINADIIESEASKLGIDRESTKKEALKEALKEDAKKEATARETVKELMQVEPRSLFVAKSVFPFDLFPDKLSIEETRVNIVNRQFFFTRHITSIGIDNIIDVSVQTSIFFATLHITSKMYVQNVVEPFEIDFLKKNDAIKARNIIEGLRIIISKQVDTTKISINELVKEVEELGKPNGISA